VKARVRSAGKSNQTGLTHSVQQSLQVEGLSRNLGENTIDLALKDLTGQPPPACSKLQDTARYAQCTNLAPHFQAVFEIADSRLPPPEDLLRFGDGFEYAISWNGLCQRYSRQASRSKHDR